MKKNGNYQLNNCRWATQKEQVRNRRKMSKEKFIVRHGELILKGIKELPKGCKIIKESNREILAWSETHHHHVLTTNLSKFKVYSFNGEKYLEVIELSELIHEKTGKDVHTPHKIAPGFYKVNIKVHFDYFAKKIAQVRD